ncbi:MAG: stage II sporulation protein D [Syntrophomonadaceae bacterium]|nr:stage II sporulation protein D [Syntrophomonadaceae bacterium]
MRSWRVKRKKYLLIIIPLIIAFCFFNIKSCEKNISIKQNPKIKLYLSKEKRVIELPLEEYITGTVAAEMPASFDLQALKAQAVAARSYTIKKILSEKAYPLGADVADDINSCQAYISKEEYARRNPQNYEPLWDKVRQAVEETAGQIMVYKGEVIDALYHSTCGGSTESAADAWGQDVSYLRSVKCSYCQESNKYQTCQVFSQHDLRLIPGVNTDKKTIIKISAKSATGRVKKLEINGITISGEKFRNALNLPSTNWEFKSEKDKLIINSRGYGHGLGLCQYGADGMAKAGENYRGILKHYYSNIDFYQLQWKKD